MPTYSRQERLAAIQKAGFPQPLTALSVSLAEFGENRDINAQSQSESRYANGQQEQSFGPWQIHLPAHPDITRSCAMELNCSTAAAFKISNGGTNFNPWSAYTSGAHLPFLSELQTSIKGIDVPAPDPGNTGPSSGGSSGPTECRPFNEIDFARIFASNARGFGPADMARDLGVTLDCLKTRIGGGITNSDRAVNTPVLGGVAQTITGNAPSPVKSVTDFLQLVANAFRSDNIWRVGFVALGLAGIWVGGRLYLKQDVGTEQPREALT